MNPMIRCYSLMFLIVLAFGSSTCGKQKNFGRNHASISAIDTLAPSSHTATNDLKTDTPRAESEPEPQSTPIDIVEPLPTPPKRVLRTRGEFLAAVAKTLGLKQADLAPAYVVVKDSLPASSAATAMTLHAEFLPAVARVSSLGCNLFWTKSIEENLVNADTPQDEWLNLLLQRVILSQALQDATKIKIVSMIQESGLSTEDKFKFACSALVATKSFL